MKLLAWGQKVSPLFREKAIAIAARGGFDPSWLMACIAFESGRSFSPAIRNAAGSGATGLIQFLPSTAVRLGTTVDALARMTAEEQMDYVDKYFAPYVGRLHTLSDVYMAILRPTGIGKPEDWPLIPGTEEQTYFQNKGLDLDKDGNITKAEATAFVARALEDGLVNTNATLLDQEPAMPNAIETAAGIASIFNPLAGGIIGLAGNIFKAFQPALQEKIAKEVNRHTDDPQIGVQVASDLANLVVSQAKILTGKTDDFQAAAAAVTQPENLAKLETSIDGEIERVSKAGDKASSWDQVMWNAQNVGRQTVSTIAIEEKRAGLWDMTRMLVMVGGGTASAIVLLIAGAIVYQSIWGKDGIDVGLVGLGGPLLMAAIQCWKDVFAYRFDGTKESTAQSQALVAAATKGVTRP